MTPTPTPFTDSTIATATKVRSVAAGAFLIRSGWEPLACVRERTDPAAREYGRALWLFPAEAYADLEIYMVTRDRLARMEADLKAAETAEATAYRAALCGACRAFEFERCQTEACRAMREQLRLSSPRLF